MEDIDLTKTISQLLQEHPSFALVFKRFQIDPHTCATFLLPEICAINRLSLPKVIRELEGSRIVGKYQEEEVLATYGIAELIGHILFSHHAFLEKELPRLEELLGKAVLENGAEHSELLELEPLLKEFKESMFWHMQEEEKHLFPFFLLMVEGSTPSPPLNEEGIVNLIRLFENEDEQIRLDLNHIKEKTRNYHIPEGVGQAFRDFYRDLGWMEIDLNRHIRVENQILFPKVIAAELEMLRGEGPSSRGVEPSII